VPFRERRRDVEAMLEEVDADVEWHPAILGSLRGEAAVYRGHEGVRELFRDLYEAFTISGSSSRRSGISAIESSGSAAGVRVVRRAGSRARSPSPW